ncbi:MAG: cytochrome c [Pseudorhodoplanes sp.]|nr:cytochrome c [Pseudorhodoplanes sp.]
MARRIVSDAAITLIAALLFAVSLARGAQAADVVEGERLARRACSSCHSFTGNRPSAMAAAPAFASIARSSRFKQQGPALILRSHIQMPNFAFTAEQAENVAAFIRTFGKPAR